MKISEKRIKDFHGLFVKGESCWTWTGYKDSKGYGGFYMSTTKKMERAHRVSVFLKTGDWPKDHVLHSCDNPSCVNPDHLSEGTHLENMRDAINKKRFSVHIKEKCKRGHNLSGENLYKKRKNRDCKLCAKERWIEKKNSRSLSSLS